jgi:class 3 adenylate cyclase
MADALGTHPLTLQFQDPALERAFQQDSLPAAMRQSRRTILVIAILLTVYMLMMNSPELFNVPASWVRSSHPQDALVDGPPVLAIGSVPVTQLFIPLMALSLWAGYAFTRTRWFGRLLRPTIVFTFLTWLPLWAAGYLINYGYSLKHHPELLSLARVNAQYTLAIAIIVMVYVFVFTRGGFLLANLVAWLTVVALPTTIALALGRPFPWGVTFMFYPLLGYVVAMAAGYVVESGLRRDFVLRRELAAEREKSERLLLNVLPASIAERLKSGEEVIADAHPEATILFADIVDFSDISSRVAPDRLVGLLNTVFTAFDRLAANLRLEKIKTVGDAYMVVAGLPAPRPDHAEAIAEMALAMQEAVRHMTAPTGDPLRLRIGINSGPVVAGVIGTAKFAYDLWGDAVNTASRMEAHGIPGAIQVTEATYERLREKHRFEVRGTVELKGKGPQLTYLLLGSLVDTQGEAPKAIAQA